MTEFYRKRIIAMIKRIEQADLLKRIYDLAEYLYIHKKE